MWVTSARRLLLLRYQLTRRATSSVARRPSRPLLTHLWFHHVVQRHPVLQMKLTQTLAKSSRPQIGRARFSSK